MAGALKWLRSVWDSYWVRVFGGSALLVGALPLVLQGICVTKDYGEGVLVGTGVAIIWYTVETFYLRRETALLRQASSRQIDIMSEQKEATIRPLVISRVEIQQYFETPAWYPSLVLRNIGHGPALFAEVRMFAVNVWTKGDWRLEIDPVDLVEPGKAEVLVIKPHVADGAGPGPHVIPTDAEVVNSLRAGQDGNATASYAITITYEDVEKRRFETVMQMGNHGTRLLSYRVL
jgi:hypothetical protein